MRILIVTQYFWPENFRINDLALALKERGHEVTVLTGMPNYPSGKMFDGYAWWKKRRDNMQGIPIIRAPLFARRESKSWQLVLNFLSFALSGCLFGLWLLRRQQFDIVFVYEPSPITVGIPAMVMRTVKNAPMIFWVQDLWPESLSATGAINSQAVLSAVRRLVKWIYHNCDRILVQSRGFIEPVVAVGAERNKVDYFPNWAESLYQPVKANSNALERLEIPDEGFIAMFAGNLGEAQSLDTILDAAEITKEKPIYWVFLGDGRRRIWMREEVEKRQLANVHLLGSRPVETMPVYFSLADVMLVTLSPDPMMTKTIPGKVQSYLACARPIVGALDGEGAKVIDESGSGFTVASGDAKGLAEAVLRMSEMSDLSRQTMGQAASIYYRQHFDREQLVSQLEVWMHEMRSEKL